MYKNTHGIFSISPSMQQYFLCQVCTSLPGLSLAAGLTALWYEVRDSGLYCKFSLGRSIRYVESAKDCGNMKSPLCAEAVSSQRLWLHGCKSCVGMFRVRFKMPQLGDANFWTSLCWFRFVHRFLWKHVVLASFIPFQPSASHVPRL